MDNGCALIIQAVLSTIVATVAIIIPYRQSKLTIEKENNLKKFDIAYNKKLQAYEKFVRSVSNVIHSKSEDIKINDAISAIYGVIPFCNNENRELASSLAKLIYETPKSEKETDLKSLFSDYAKAISKDIFDIENTYLNLELKKNKVSFMARIKQFFIKLTKKKR